MPFGSHSAQADITQLLCFTNPRSILDLGIGNGMNGAVVRNYCGFDRKLVGVEGWGEYRNPMWDLYDKVHVTRIEDFLSENKEFFQAILMTDVIEHFTIQDGLKVIELAKRRLNPMGCLLISTPAVWIEQGGLDNELEDHKSLWTAEMFERLGFTMYRGKEPCKYGHMMLIAEYLNR